MSFNKPTHIDFIEPRDFQARTRPFDIVIWFLEEPTSYSITVARDDNTAAVHNSLLTLIEYEEEKYHKYHEGSTNETISSQKNTWYKLAFEYYFNTVPSALFTLTYSTDTVTNQEYKFVINQQGGTL